MANSATLLDTIPCAPGPMGPLLEYQIVIDTTGADLTVRTPASGNRVFVVGGNWSEATSGNIILKSGSSKTHTLELGANQGVYDKSNRGLVFATKAGEALIIQTSMAFTSLILHCIEADRAYWL